MSRPVSVAENQRGELREAPISPALSRGGGKPGSGYSAVRDGSKIRRLTPTERERLMGAPGGWTYPWGPSLADAPTTGPVENACAVDYPPDGPRESASGDGVAVPCAEWIANRLRAETQRAASACSESRPGVGADPDRTENGDRA